MCGRFEVDNVEYYGIGENRVILSNIYGNYDHFIVPSHIISNSGTKYIIIGILFNKLAPMQLQKSKMTISFDSHSEIEAITLSSIICFKTIKNLPPNIKRIKSESYKRDSLLNHSHTVILDKGNHFVSVIKQKSIMNHFPLELLDQHFFRSRLLIRETVQIIGHCSFLRNDRIKTVVIPASVCDIGDYAFARCYSLQRLIFKRNSKLKKIGDHAFEESSLINVDFPSSVEEIDDAAFCSCTKLAIVSFQDDSNLRKIGHYAFNNTNIKSIVFPKKIEEIGFWAFFKCASLSSISFPGGLKHVTIQNNTFLHCNCEEYIIK